MRALVVNAGSSTLKLSVIGDDDETIAAETVGPSDRDAVRALSAEHGPIGVSGHRIVHGGGVFTEPVVVDDEVLARLESLVPLAPLHQPRGIDGVRIARALLPGVPAVACFDTAFHATLAPAAYTYALPESWRADLGVRRFGFHGLSHAWASARACEIANVPAAGSRVVTCHLGAGSSVGAVRDGRSVDTTMGFTPVDGLVMATRSGSVDPGLVVWLIRTAGIGADVVDDALEHRSGLAALSGTSGDMRAILAAAAEGDGRARLAIDVWVHRLRQAIAAMAASLGGIDVLAFTGGIGEHAPTLRATVGEGLAFLGAGLDPAVNAMAEADADISAAGATCRTVVVTAREDLQIARLVRHLT